MSSRLRAFVPLLLLALTACSADKPLNDSFPVKHKDAKALLKEMGADPRPLERPLVVTGGIHDPGFAAGHMTRKMKKITTEDTTLVTVTFTGRNTFDRCRDRLIELIEAKLPSDDPDETVEVDVVAFSMGGLVARYAALPRDDGGKRLNMRRLFTICSPHAGAKWANLPTLDQRVKDMRAGSAFLVDLNGRQPDADYELFTYTRLEDTIVGPENAAPPGQTAWWVANVPFTFAHLNAVGDARIAADIARRLRGEEPLATTPPAPLPHAAAVEEPEEGNRDGGS